MRSVQLAIKRLLDVVVCVLVIILCWPFMVAIALLVKFSSPGPVFFIQERVGWKGSTFKMIKFRSMSGQPTPEAQATWTEAEEARITPVGGFLRDYGLDELPQVLNIIKGDMSIVGPRPPLPIQAKDYTENQRKVYRMRPGVLSLAAVEGRRSIPLEDRIGFHVWYVENWSLHLDLMILWRALLVVMRRQDASEPVAS